MNAIDTQPGSAGDEGSAGVPASAVRPSESVIQRAIEAAYLREIRAA